MLNIQNIKYSINGGPMITLYLGPKSRKITKIQDNKSIIKLKEIKDILVEYSGGDVTELNKDSYRYFFQKESFIVQGYMN